MSTVNILIIIFGHVNISCDWICWWPMTMMPWLLNQLYDIAWHGNGIYGRTFSWKGISRCTVKLMYKILSNAGLTLWKSLQPHTCMGLSRGPSVSLRYRRTNICAACFSVMTSFFCMYVDLLVMAHASNVMDMLGCCPCTLHSCVTLFVDTVWLFIRLQHLWGFCFHFKGCQ